MISTSLPWQVRYEPGVPADIVPPASDFPGLLAAAAADAPGYSAIVYYNRRFSYAELNKAVDQAASACIRDGVQPGDRVLIALPNGPQAVLAALGAMRAGAVLVALPPAAASQVAESLIATASPRLAFMTSKLVEGISSSALVGSTALVRVDADEGLPLSLRLLRRGLGGTRRSGARARAWRDWFAVSRSSDLPSIGPEDPAMQVFDLDDPELGSQVFEHRHLVAGATQLQVWLTDAHPGDDSWLLLAPLIDPFGLTVGLGTAFGLRARLLLLPAWTSADVSDAARFLRPSYVVATGPAVVSLVARPELARMDLRSVRAWIASDDVGPSTASAFEAATGLALCQGFAPAGVAGLATCNPINGRRVPGSVGLPLPGVDIRIGSALATGEGLELAGPNVAAEGWLPAARRARADAAGFLYIGGPRP